MEEQNCQIRLKEKEIKTRIQESLIISTQYIKKSRSSHWPTASKPKGTAIEN